MTLNITPNNNPYVYIDESKTSTYSLDFSNNAYCSQMSAFFKRYERNSDYFQEYDIWKDVVLPEDSFKNIPHLFHVNFTSLYSYSNTLIDSAYKQSLSPTIPTQLYPIATRYIDSSGNYFIERPPFQVDIDYKVGGASSSTKKRVTNKKLWIPWTLFIFNPQYMGSAKMYFSHKSLTNQSDIYVSPYLPNTYTSGEICFSNSLNSIPDLPSYSTLSINQIYSLMINEYFAGSWNSDLSNSWMNFYSNFFKPIFANFPEDIEIYPQAKRLFDPSNEDIAQALPPSSKTSKQLLNYAPKINRLSCLDYQYFHEYILSMLATFSLEDILALMEELSNVHIAVTDPDHKYNISLPVRSMIHRFYSEREFSHINTFSFIKQSLNVLNYRNHSTHSSPQRILNQLSSFPVVYSLPSEYNSSHTNILIYNNSDNFLSVDSYFLRYDASFNYSHYCFNQNVSAVDYSRIINKVIQDSFNGVTIQEKMYCFDFLTKQIHVLPYSFELYKQIVTDSSNSQIDILGYINDKV